MAKTTGTINIKSIDFNANSNTTEIIWNLGGEAVKEERNASKSRIMKRAWRRAKTAAMRFGGSARDYISSTMSSAWKSERRLASSDIRTRVKGKATKDLIWRAEEHEKAINNLMEKGYSRQEAMDILMDNEKRKTLEAAGKINAEDLEMNAILNATMQIDQLEQVLRDAMKWGEEHDESGSALESINGANLLEFIEDVRSAYSDTEIMEFINASKLNITSLKQLASELTRAHYDDRYAKWAGGTEEFKQDLKRFQKALTGVAGDELVEMFFM